MRVVEDAQELLNGMDPGPGGMCLFCYGTDQVRRDHIEHKPGCVYLRRDKILAALEAAEKTVWLLETFPTTDDSGYAHHVLAGIKQELVAALRGES
jgi:hypothetical protein